MSNWTLSSRESLSLPFIWAQPVIPGFVEKSLRFLKEDKIEWNSINKTLLNCKIDNFEAIVTRIDDNHLDKLMGN